MDRPLTYIPVSLQDGTVIALQAGDERLVSRIHYRRKSSVNYLEVAKPQIDSSCHFKVVALDGEYIALQAKNGQYVRIVEKQVTSTLSLDTLTFYRSQETFLWVMTEACSREEAARFQVLTNEQGTYVFQAENGGYIGYNRSYTFADRYPLLLVDPEQDPESEVDFALKIVKAPRNKRAASAILKLTPDMRVLEPYRAAMYWFDDSTFDDTLVGLKAGPVHAFLVKYGDIVDGIQALYGEKNLALTPAHGNVNQEATLVELEEGDSWSEISGFYGEWFAGIYVLQLTFHTREGLEYGPFGSMNYATNIQPFSLKIEPDEKIVALKGVVACGDNGRNRHLGALGLVVRKDKQS